MSNAGYMGPDQFTFNVQDNGGTVGGGQNVSAPATVDIQVVNSIDPNDMLGPEGVGPEGAIAPEQSLPFTIRFENYAAATAPAQAIVVQTALDADLDWSTFRFGEIAFGATRISAADDAQSLSSTVELAQADGTMLEVHLEAELDPRAGVVSWRLQAIDPAQGAPPQDPLAGFLPPNQSDHRGEGHVQFTIQPRSDSDPGARIDASASIIFDANPAMLTNELVYTILSEDPAERASS
jgi:hypothetical protein